MSICLLFDNDGTLVDSERLSCVAYVRLFSTYGVNLDADELEIRFKGNKLNDILKALSSEHHITLRNDFVQQYRTLIAELFEQELKPIDGIHATLEQLSYPKAIVSGGPPEKIKQALNICNLTHFFDENIFSSYDINSWKPEPAIYLHAAQTMQYLPSNCYVIEDSMAGLAAGSRAGMKTFFYNTKNIEPPCETITSFSNMLDLPKLINN